MPKIKCPHCGSIGQTTTVPGVAWDSLICELCEFGWLSPPRDDLPFELQAEAVAHIPEARRVVAEQRFTREFAVVPSA